MAVSPAPPVTTLQIASESIPGKDATTSFNSDPSIMLSSALPALAGSSAAPSSAAAEIAASAPDSSFPSQPSYSVQPFHHQIPSFHPGSHSSVGLQTSQSTPTPLYAAPSLQPPGVSGAPASANGATSAPGMVAVSMPQLAPSPVFCSPAVRPYPQIINGYTPAPVSIPGAQPQTVPPPGVPRFPPPYTGIIRPPIFAPRPPGVAGVIPPLARPPMPGIPGVPPVVAPLVRPVVPIVVLPEKPQTTVYVGKIAPTVSNEFLLSLLRLCGPVKSWKRAQDPSDGSPRGFGFCEFESAEGVLRALRLLSKYNVDGQELVLNVNQATREYLERYVEKKTERERKIRDGEIEDGAEEDEGVPGVEKKEPPKPAEESKKDASAEVEKEQADPKKFGVVTDEDREADRDALEKLNKMVEERSKNIPPQPPYGHVPAKSTSEVPSKSKEGDSEVDNVKSDATDDRNDVETTSERRATNDHEKRETGEKARIHDRRSRDRGRDLKRDKERELERYEREQERERSRRERERELKMRESERLYKERVKEWETREREKEYRRQHDKEREKEKERSRRREIKEQEEVSDDEDARKRWRRSSMYEEKKRKRQREKEEDADDKLKEEEELAEAKKREAELKRMEKLAAEMSSKVADSIKLEHNEAHQKIAPSNAMQIGDSTARNGRFEVRLESDALSDAKQSGGAPARKLGFGLVGSGKRTAVLSVFHEEEEEDGEKDKKMRPLVPIDYSIDELQAVQNSVSGGAPHLAAAAEFAKRLSSTNHLEEKAEPEKEKSRRSSDRSNQRERGRESEESSRGRDESKERAQSKVSESKKLLDAKQLIDMIPKTKDELFSYDINWTTYDKHALHERMRPWISKKITEFLGEEEVTLVDYIVSSTKEHVKASQMLELLQSILDDEAEMFVLKMWRMLIFEIKKVESGLDVKPRIS